MDIYGTFEPRYSSESSGGPHGSTNHISWVKIMNSLKAPVSAEILICVLGWPIGKQI